MTIRVRKSHSQIDAGWPGCPLLATHLAELYRARLEVEVQRRNEYMNRMNSKPQIPLGLPVWPAPPSIPIPIAKQEDKMTVDTVSTQKKDGKKWTKKWDNNLTNTKESELKPTAPLVPSPQRKEEEDQMKRVLAEKNDSHQAAPPIFPSLQKKETEKKEKKKEEEEGGSGDKLKILKKKDGAVVEIEAGELKSGIFHRARILDPFLLTTQKEREEFDRIVAIIMFGDGTTLDEINLLYKQVYKVNLSMTMRKQKDLIDSAPRWFFKNSKAQIWAGTPEIPFFGPESEPQCEKRLIRIIQSKGEILISNLEMEYMGRYNDCNSHTHTHTHEIYFSSSSFLMVMCSIMR